MHSALLIVVVLVVIWAMCRSIKNGFGEAIHRFTSDNTEYIIRVANRRDTEFAAVTSNGVECGTLTTGAFWRDIKHIAQTARGRRINIYVLPGANWQEVGGLLTTAIMMARGSSFENAYGIVKKNIPKFVLIDDYKLRLRDIRW